MARFSAGEVRVLVSTSVIEVGLDVHGATLLVVQHAERFGLAQLHQLRGRVGRGRKAGLALLIPSGAFRGGDFVDIAGAMLAVLLVGREYMVRNRESPADARS